MNMNRAIPHGIFLVLLLAGALWLPLPLYLVSLAVFGLPHVIWEMGFLRSRYGARWPTGWWLMLWTVLLLQAGIRGAVWLDAYPAASSLITDLLALLLLGMILVLAPGSTGWRARIAGAVLACGMFWLLEHGELLTALLLLALAHNFTPVALAWDMARDHPPATPLAWAISGLFMLPLLLPLMVAGSGWTGGATSLMASHVPLLDGQLPATWDGQYRQALLSAVVLAQCLHYYCVIVLLPHAEQRRVAQPVLPASIRILTLAAVALMLVYFSIDYGAARKLYAVAAGAHAWIEWPVLLMAFLSRPRQQNTGNTYTGQPRTG